MGIVEIDGTAREIVVGKSTGKPEVDALYVNAVRTWSFSSALIDGVAVAQQIKQVIAINLD